MNKTRILLLFAVLLIGAMVFSACKPAATPEPEIIEVEKEVEVEVEVTRIVEGEVVTEVIVVTATPAPEEPATEVEEVVVGGTFNWATGALVQFDCPLINDDASIEMVSLVHTFLFRGIRDEEGNEVHIPELAHSWEFEEGGKVVIFHLEEGWTFQDGNDVFAEGEGREIVADDVVYSIERLATMEGTGAPSDLITNFVSIEALDDYTVKLTLANPDAVLFSPGRGITSGCIIPKEAVEQLGEDWGLHPIGGGPFEFVEYVPDDHATLVRNEDFVIQPYLDEVVFKVIPDDDVQMIALEAGEVHFAYLPETESAERINGQLYHTYCVEYSHKKKSINKISELHIA